MNRDPFTNDHRERDEEWTKPEPSGPSPALIALWVFIGILIGGVVYLGWLSRGGAQ